MKTIGCFTSVYFNNIGNAFIDFGAIATIEAALPQDTQLVKLSQFPNFASSMAKGMLLKESAIFRTAWKYGLKAFGNILHDKSYNFLPPKKVLNLVEMAKLDALIVPGCVLTVPFFTLYFDVLKRISQRGTKIIFLGASGNYYSDNEVKMVKDFLTHLKPAAFISRDSKAFELYKDFSEQSYNGIDNAFFVNKLNLPKVETYLDPFVVLNFDDHRNTYLYKELKNKFENVIITNHKPFPLQSVKRLIDKNIMVSDTPLDYLFLYSNALEVHSDRVHACIPTLSFGGKCKIYSDSPRIKLFENAGVTAITKEVTGMTGLGEMQQNQISRLNSIVNSI